MFIVVTIGCIWLAIVATRARNQQQAVANVEKLGGVLFFDYQKDSRGNQVTNGQPSAPEWLRRAIGEDYFRRVDAVDFNFGGGNKATDEDLAVFRSLPDVTTIELNNNPRVTDAGLAHLAGLSKLRVLYLYRSQVKGPGIRHLPRNIEFLMLTRTPLADEGLVPVKNMTRLTGLRLGFTKVTDEGLVNLSGLSALEDLELRNTDLSDAGLEHLRSLKNLKSLSLDHTKVKSAGIARLKQALPKCFISPDPKWLDAQPQDIELWPDGYKPSTDEILAKIGKLDGDADVKVDKTRPEQPIVSFRLFDSTISDEGLIRLLAAMPELERLNLRRVLVGDRLAKELPRLSKLGFLSLDESRITDEGLADLGRVVSLKEVSLRSTKISDAGLMHLAGLKNLQQVYANECDLSDDGYARFKQALPKCSISR
jgi:Leucine-rich repeat (LRR) protein